MLVINFNFNMKFGYNEWRTNSTILMCKIEGKIMANLKCEFIFTLYLFTLIKQPGVSII